MIIATMSIMQSLLLERVRLSTGEEQANMVLFDVQSSQREGIISLFEENKLPILDQIPIVTVQIDRINGFTSEQIRQDTTLRWRSGAMGNEIRATYRAHLDASERVTKGEWIGKVAEGDTARISLDEGYAQRVGLALGDIIDFNVQGVRVTTILGSFRAVDWDRVQPNFRVVFPSGIIDQAPQFHVFLTRIQQDQAGATFQQQVFNRYPTVSVIDLGLVLSVLEEVLGKIAFVIQFMGGFSMLTGFLVLISSIVITKYQRIREYVLLRTLGASNKQLTRLNFIEYLLLGSIAALCGLALACGAGWLLAFYSFEIPFRPNWFHLLLLFLIVLGSTLLLGMLNFRSIRKRPPLEILRKNAS